MNFGIQEGLLVSAHRNFAYLDIHPETTQSYADRYDAEIRLSPYKFVRAPVVVRPWSHTVFITPFLTQSLMQRKLQDAQSQREEDCSCANLHKDQPWDRRHE